jgi:hypothetical protein
MLPHLRRNIASKDHRLAELEFRSKIFFEVGREGGAALWPSRGEGPPQERAAKACLPRQIILATTDCCGTTEMMWRSCKAKTGAVALVPGKRCRPLPRSGCRTLEPAAARSNQPGRILAQGGRRELPIGANCFSRLTNSPRTAPARSSC